MTELLQVNTRVKITKKTSNNYGRIGTIGAVYAKGKFGFSSTLDYSIRLDGGTMNASLQQKDVEPVEMIKAYCYEKNGEYRWFTTIQTEPLQIMGYEWIRRKDMDMEREITK